MMNNVTLEYLLKIVPGLLILVGGNVKAGLNAIFRVFMYGVGNGEYVFALDDNAKHVKCVVQFEVLYHGMYHGLDDLNMNNPLFIDMVKKISRDIYEYVHNEIKDFIWAFIQNEIEYNSLDGNDDLYDLETMVFDFLNYDNPDITDEIIPETINDHIEVISKYVDIT